MCKKCGSRRVRDNGLCLSCSLDDRREMERMFAIPSIPPREEQCT